MSYYGPASGFFGSRGGNYSSAPPPNQPSGHYGPSSGPSRGGHYEPASGGDPYGAHQHAGKSGGGGSKGRGGKGNGAGGGLGGNGPSGGAPGMHAGGGGYPWWEHVKGNGPSK